MIRVLALALVMIIVPVGVVATVGLLLSTSDRVHYRGAPDPFAPTYGNRPARQGPTARPLPPIRLDKQQLIVQQNPTCWSGFAGRTC